MLKIEPNNEKALFRKAKILQEKCRTDEAVGTQYAPIIDALVQYCGYVRFLTRSGLCDLILI